MVNIVNSEGNNHLCSEGVPTRIGGFEPAQVLFEKIKAQSIPRYTQLGEYWDRSAVEEHFEKRGVFWLALPACVNPYSSVLQELPLIEKALPWLNRRTHGRVMSFLGVGTGDVEIKIVEYCVVSADNSKPLLVEAIDLNSLFLDYFFAGVYQVSKSVRPESKGAILSRGVHGYFQHLGELPICIDGESYVYFLIGNTLSNFPDQQMAAAMFTRFLVPGDYLVIGVRQAIDDDYTLELYRDNPWLYQFMDECMDVVQWAITEVHTIRAVEMRAGRERFLTRSYTIDQLRGLFPQFVLERYWQTVGDGGSSHLKRGAILAVFKKL
ncbi:MAG: hypothetical protein WC659_02350 [Patescibacteria group bacterium]